MTITPARSIAATLAGLSMVAVALIGAGPASAAGGPPTPVPGAPASTSSFHEFQGELFLSGVAEGEIYSSLFAFDGTNFTQIPGSPVGPTQFHTLGDELIFEAIVDINALPSYSYGLFTYDGSTITQVPGAFETPNDFVSVGGVAYFQATVAGEVQLWQYDGTTASLVPGGAVSPSRLSTYNGKVYFEGDTDPSPADSPALFVYDPATPATPPTVITGAPTDISEVVAYNGLAYVGAPGALYSFNGAAPFTAISIAPATYAGALTVFDGALYFTGGDVNFGNVYYYSGGVVTKVPGALTETIQYVEYNGSLYYLGFANGEPVMNVISGGQVSALAGSPEYTFHMTVFQGKLYFTGDTDEASNIMYVYESAPADGEAALASTGVDLGMPALAALALLLVGAAVVVGARRTRRA